MKDTYDLTVAGGGPAGIGAAIAGARCGLSVLLFEKSNCLGGTMTNGLVNALRTAGDGGGIVWEFWSRLERMGCADIQAEHVRMNLFAARVTLSDMLEEAGVDLSLHTHLAGVEACGCSVAGVQVANKDGLRSVSSSIIVDATGDGDVAAAAGVAYDKGRESDGLLQAVSLNFVLAGVDDDALPDPDEFRETCRAALESGAVEMARPWNVLHCGFAGLGYPAGVRHFQFDMAHRVDGSDATSLSDGERICQQRVLGLWQYLKRTFSAFGNSIVIDVASHLGIRESRRIRGEATLTEGMVMGAARHVDAVSRCSWYMDLHDGQDKHPLGEYRKARRPADGDYYEIPYGCMVPVEVDGLLVAGRCISSTRAANGSLRLQPTCMNLGQAAGTAAALCRERSCQPRELDGVDLRGQLVEQGMEL